MGWGYGISKDGREIGYNVVATCDEPGCFNQIDRGLDYLCGSMHEQNDPHGCGGYFCHMHLFSAFADCVMNSMCGPCIDAHGGQENEEPCDWTG